MKTRSLQKQKGQSKKNKTHKRRHHHGGEVSNDSSFHLEKQLEENSISNTEILGFVVYLLLPKTDFINIINNNQHFIDTIESQELDFSKNQEYRKIINETVQWLLLDFDKHFLNSILLTLKNTFSNPQFLNEQTDINERYNVLLKNLIVTINEKTSANEDIIIIMLLKIVLRVLNMPNIKTTIIQQLQAQNQKITQFKNSIICILNYLIKIELANNEKMRLLIKELIEQMSYTNQRWEIIKKMTSITGSCGLTITSDVTKTAVSSGFGLFKKK